MKNTLSLLLALSVSGLSAQNQPPVIQAFTAVVDWPANTLTVQYDVSDAEGDALDISLAFSNDNGKTYSLGNLVPASGDLGFPVTPSANKSITCDVSMLAGLMSTFTVRLIADDRQTFDLQALVDEVDSTRMRADLEFVEGIRHRSAGAAHLAAVRDSMKNLFVQQGLYTEEQTFAYAGNYTGRNVVATLPGSSMAEKVVVVDAHYDSVANAPGADDNGSGTVGVLEIARLLSRYPAKKSLRFIGFDLEEAGLVGSIRYVSSGIPAGDQIDGVFNFEMIGYYSEQPNSQELPSGFEILFPNAATQVINNQFRGDFITNVGNANSQSLTSLFASSAAQYVPGLKVITLNVPGNGQVVPDLRRSDHVPFWDSGKPALMLTDGANFRNECYHTPQDTLDGKLNFTFMSQVTKATLAAMAQLAEIQHGDWATATFKNLVGVRELPACSFTIAPQSANSDILEFSAVGYCLASDALLEIFDEKGALQHSESLRLDSQNVVQILVPQLANGAYFAKISYAGGIRSERFWIAR